MKLCFSGLEHSIDLLKGTTAVLEVHNRVLFERICRSIYAEAGEGAIEPFALMNDEGESISPRNKFEFIANPYALPWNDRTMVNRLNQTMIRLLHEEPSQDERLHELARQLTEIVSTMALTLGSDYSLQYDWDLEKYLRAFSFGLDARTDESFFDNCIKFLSMAGDIQLEKILVLVNFKLFLSKNEIQQLFETVFFSNLCVLMLETVEDNQVYQYERKVVVDQQFLESYTQTIS